MEDKKPDVTGGAEGAVPVTITVRDQTGEELAFKVKSTTKISKVREAYASRKGVNADSIKLLFDGQRIVPTHTVAEAGIQDKDVLDCVVEQTGGALL